MDSVGFVIHMLCKILRVSPVTAEDILVESGYDEGSSVSYERNEF